MVITMRNTDQLSWRLRQQRPKQPRPQGLPRGGARAEEDPVNSIYLPGMITFSHLAVKK